MSTLDVVKARFEQKFRVTPSCWIWEGSRNGDGYGHFRYLGEVAKAHRVSYLLYVGEVPKHLKVRHKCDNPWCVNPNHLELGTDADNMADRSLRGRTAVGEANGKTKLTDAQVAEMKRLRESGVSKEDVANQFGVSTRTVWYAIKTRKLKE